MRNKLSYDIYKLGRKVGLNKKDLNSVLRNGTVEQNKSSNLMSSSSDGPPFYKANLYGAISIKDF